MKLLLVNIFETLFVIIVLFFLAVLAFGPYLTGLMDKRNKKNEE